MKSGFFVDACFFTRSRQERQVAPSLDVQLYAGEVHDIVSASSRRKGGASLAHRDASGWQSVMLRLWRVSKLAKACEAWRVPLSYDSLPCSILSVGVTNEPKQDDGLLAGLVLSGFGVVEEFSKGCANLWKWSNNVFFVVRAFHSLHGRFWGRGVWGGRGDRDAGQLRKGNT